MPAESSRTKAEPSNAALNGSLSTSIVAGTNGGGGFVNEHYQLQRVKGYTDRGS